MRDGPPGSPIYVRSSVAAVLPGNEAATIPETVREEFLRSDFR